MQDIKHIINSYDSIVKNIEDDIESKLISVAAIIIFLSILLFVVVLWYIMLNFEGKHFPGWDFWLLIFSIGIPSITFFSFYNSRNLMTLMVNPLLRSIKLISNAIIEAHEDIYNNIELIENIDEILIKTNKIHELQNRLSKMRFFVFIFSPRNWKEFTETIYQSLFWCIEILANLRSDLWYILQEQTSTLEKAKSSLSTHVHWTTELNQVSELQRARLDKQIGQFEELQRVLVRV